MTSPAPTRVLFCSDSTRSYFRDGSFCCSKRFLAPCYDLFIYFFFFTGNETCYKQTRTGSFIYQQQVVDYASVHTSQTERRSTREIGENTCRLVVHFLPLSVTFAQRFRVIPVWIPRADALDDGGPLFQSVSRVTGELDHGADAVQRVGGGEVSVLEVRLVAVASLESWRRKWKLQRAQHTN